MRGSAFCRHKYLLYDACVSIYDACGTCFSFLRIILEAVAVCMFSMSRCFCLSFLFCGESSLGVWGISERMVNLPGSSVVFPRGCGDGRGLIVVVQGV